ncbi:MAG TPA: Maf family protein [Pyrinomonadaceae bacterium]|nr:Maf family protein [Pyrinomonadaceae bacterium]
MLREKIVLASQSPRRAEILTTVGWQFEAIAANIDETRFPSEDAPTYVKRLAQIKAETVAKQIVSGGLVLGADTVVVIDEEILGQPRDDDDARRMLSLLSGKWHQVVTGVALLRGSAAQQTSVGQQTTRVLFAKLSSEQIDWYVSTGEPKGKAGAYAIQGKGALLIEEIQGDYFNVVGLPVRLVFELMRKM